MILTSQRISIPEDPHGRNMSTLRCLKFISDAVSLLTRVFMSEGILRHPNPNINPNHEHNTNLFQ